jgi:hypothetical protein
METSEVREVVEREMPGLLRRLGLGRWKVRVSYAHRAPEDGTVQRGECTRLVDYDDACITLNPGAFDDEAGVLVTLRHELFHIVLAPFDLFMATAERLVETPSPAADVLDRIWGHAVERAVIALERMYSGLVPAE